MKYTMLIVYTLATPLLGMKYSLPDRPQEIIEAATARAQNVNQRLLAIVRHNDRAQVKTDLENYPQKTTTKVAAYLQQPIQNTYTYLKLLRDSSTYARRHAEATLRPEDRAMAAVDSHMFARANKQWSFRTKQFELQGMADELNQIYTQAYASLVGWGKNHETATKGLDSIKNDHEALLRAIEICKQSSQNQ